MPTSRTKQRCHVSSFIVTSLAGRIDISSVKTVNTLVYLPLTGEFIEYDTGKEAFYKECHHAKYMLVLSTARSFSCQQDIGVPQKFMSCDNYPALLAYWLFYPGHDQNKRVVPRHGPFVQAFEDYVQDSLPLDKLNDRAYRRLKDAIQIERKISIINFLAELKDLHRMVDFWSRRRTFLNNIANGHLNIKYGWKPFISDVISMVQALGSFRNDLRRLLKNEHKILFSRYHMKVPDFTIDHSGTGFLYPPPATPMEPFEALCQEYFEPATGVLRPNQSLVETEFSNCELRSTIKYSYICKELSVLQAKVRAFCDAYGIALDPQIIWDAIPFSFVVDWFFRVGDFLHDIFAKNNFPVDLRIHEACVSIKTHQRTRYSVFVASHGDACTAVPSEFSAELRGTQFKRIRHYPSVDDLIHSGWGWNILKRVHTGAALLTTNTARPKHPERLPRRSRK